MVSGIMDGWRFMNGGETSKPRIRDRLKNFFSVDEVFENYPPSETKNNERIIPFRQSENEIGLGPQFMDPFVVLSRMDQMMQEMENDMGIFEPQRGDDFEREIFRSGFMEPRY